MARLPLTESAPNVLAFLDMLAWSEIGPSLLAASDDGYNVDVGGKLFDSYQDHPRKLVVVNSKGLESTAAGRYQFLERTWDDLRKSLNLTDFSPENQDRACIELMHQHRSIVWILAGDITKAISMNAPIWASLPGAGYGQGEHTLAQLLPIYYAAVTRYEQLEAALK